MALQTSGPIAGSDVNEELGRSASAQFNLGGPEERELADILSGAISLSDFYGAASLPSVTFVNTSNRTGANIYSLMGQQEKNVTRSCS